MPERVGNIGGVSVLRNDAPGARWAFVYAPGAGSNLQDPFGAHLSERLPAAGVALVRFQFPYQESGKRAPDKPLVLEDTWRTVLEASRESGVRIAIGGRSMGGRVASVVAVDASCDALALFAYPLHPPGRPEQARTDHFDRIPCPVLLCSGTRDAFGSPDRLASAATALPDHTIHLLDGADHGFSTPKASGRTREQIWEEASEAFLRWITVL